MCALRDFSTFVRNGFAVSTDHVVSRAVPEIPQAPDSFTHTGSESKRNFSAEPSSDYFRSNDTWYCKRPAVLISVTSLTLPKLRWPSAPNQPIWETSWARAPRAVAKAYHRPLSMSCICVASSPSAQPVEASKTYETRHVQRRRFRWLANRYRAEHALTRNRNE